MIPYGRQDIPEADIEAVVAVLRSDWLTQGPAVPRFEETVARYCGAEHGVAVNSATSALHLACLALGVGKGDRVWTSPNTFVASANCALYCGATVDFVDTDSRTYNLSVEALSAKLRQARAGNRLPKVVIPVHFAGQSCDMRAIGRLADEYGFSVIEDASHAVGGRYLDKPIGRCRYSDISIFSFHPVKVITTGEGGMALTNRTDLATSMKRLRSHGITRDPSELTAGSHGPWYYEQLELGFNYRMTDLQAALGGSQMTRLDAYVERRRALAARYDGLLAGLPLQTPWQSPETASAWHLYVVRLSQRAGGIGRKEIAESLRGAGIGTNVHYIPVHTQPYYRDLGFREGMFPEAESYYAEVLTLPLFPNLTEAQQDHIVRELRRALG